LLPALFMTSVVTTYIMLAPEGFTLSKAISYPTGFAVTMISFAFFLAYSKKNYNNRQIIEK
jgi:uncharacterized membrane protein YoaT (DUF817 family)